MCNHVRWTSDPLLLCACMQSPTASPRVAAALARNGVSTARQPRVSTGSRNSSRQTSPRSPSTGSQHSGSQPISRTSSPGSRKPSGEAAFARHDLIERLRLQLQEPGKGQPRQEPEQDGLSRDSFAFPKPPANPADAAAPAPMLTVQPQPVPLQDRTSSWTQLQLAMSQSEMREAAAAGSSSGVAGGSLASAGTTPFTNGGAPGGAAVGMVSTTETAPKRTASLQAALRDLRRGSQDSSVDGGEAKAANLKFFQRGSSESIGSELSRPDVPRTLRNPSFEAAMARNYRRGSGDGGSRPSSAPSVPPVGAAGDAPAGSQSAPSLPPLPVQVLTAVLYHLNDSCFVGLCTCNVCSASISINATC